MTAAVAPLLPGETLGGKYRIERVLGQGGMGIVVAARHLDLDERVAIKFLLGAPSDRAVERFLREARAAVKVKGEHVCRVFDFGRLETGEPYIVMEYLDGIDLAAKLKREGPQPIDLVAGWIIEACAALADAHDSGIVHRDLKPANVLLATRPDGSTCAKVLDFGISKLPQADTLTNPDAMMGSPIYMSPEQIESARDVDVRSDVWSLGIVLYELLAGSPPFRADSMIELAVQVREKEPTPLAEVRPEVPRALQDVVTRCLAKKVDQRYASVVDLARDLAPFAPSDVAPLAKRLARRAQTVRSGEQIAFDATLSAEAGPGAALQGTFSPLHTSVERERPPSDGGTRRWALLAAAGAGAALVVVIALRSSSSSSVAVAPEAAAPSAALLEKASSTPEPIATAPASGPGAEADAGAPLMPVSVAPVASPTSPRPAVHRRASDPAEPQPVLAGEPPAASSAPAEGSPRTPQDRKKRPIDRDDP